MRRVFHQSIAIAVIALGCVVLAFSPEAGAADTWTEDQLLFAAEVGDTDYFGRSIATDGSTALVGVVYDDEGAYGNAGSVCVFERTGRSWVQVDRLVAGDYINSGYFGVSVAMSGDTAIFGSSGVEVKKGAAYVFVREAGAWVEQQKLTADDGVAFDEFGISVDIDGDTAVVGAVRDDHSMLTEPGSAYVFTRAGTVWSLEQKLMADVPETEDWFGYRVAISGDTVVVGAFEYEADPPYRTGAAYVFTRSGNVWSQVQKLNGSGGADDKNFGWNLEVAGDTIVIGASATDHSGLDNAGAAYVFTESGSTWTEQQRLVASDAAANDNFGAVALDGDTILVGAQNADIPGMEGTGAAYLFLRSAGTWAEQKKLMARYPEADARFGAEVVLTSEIALVAASFMDAGAVAEAGAVLSYGYAAQLFADGFESGDITAWAAPP